MNGLLTIDEAAKMLNMSYTTIYRWIKAKKLPAYQSGFKGVYRIKREDLERFLQGANK